MEVIEGGVNRVSLWEIDAVWLLHTVPVFVGEFLSASHPCAQHRVGCVGKCPATTPHRMSPRIVRQSIVPSL